MKKEIYYKQGIYPVDSKYKGTLPCVYRSSAEFKIMQWFTRTSSIIEWSSESHVVPYVKPTDNRVHRYFIDFSCTFKDKTSGRTAKYLLEYKPYKQMFQPTKTARKSDKTYLTEVINYSVNQAKWNAAKQYATSKGMQFLVINEKDIGIEAR